MDPKPNDEPAPDRVGHEPEQHHLTEILELVKTTSLGGDADFIGIYQSRLYSAPGRYDNSIDPFYIEVSGFTNKGERMRVASPDLPKGSLAQIQIAKKKEDGWKIDDYRISEENGRLIIYRYEKITAEEPFKKKEGEKDTIEMLERRLQDKNFEREIGATYVDSTEAQRIIDILTKVANKE